MKVGPSVDIDTASISAFAVYKNMIPGIASYEDTSTSSVRSRKKKKRRRSSAAKAKAAVIKKEEGQLQQKASHISPSGSTPSPKKKKKNKKRKLVELGQDEVELLEASVETLPAEVLESGKKKKKRMVAEESRVSEEELDLATEDRNLSAAADTPRLKKKKKSVKSPIEETATTNGIGKKKTKDSALPNSEQVRVSPRSLDALFSSEPIHDSVMHGKSLFEWLIHPTPIGKFFAEYWEKKPLHVKRLTKRDYYSWLISSSGLDEVLRNNFIKFEKNIDITSYVDGKRQTHNPEGRALPAIVWDFYSNGNSVRFLNPQTYIKPIWRLNSGLQEYLGTFVGANLYLTPPDSQGFAPHFDDIEAFVVQVEGRKHWKLYKPRNKEEELPRFSSRNFNEECDSLGEPILDVILAPGDLLYFPRGTIHQAKAVEEEHSLHVTISAYQTNTYADFLKVYLPMALEQSVSESLELRKGLPIDFLSFMGFVYSDRKEKKIMERRAAFEKKIKKLTEKILLQSCDLAADQLGKKLIWDSLPPYLTSKEKRRSVYKDGEFICEGTVLNRVEIGPDVEVKLIRKHACRLVIEEGSLRLFFNSQNSMEYHGEEAAYVELPENAGPAMEYLFERYPDFAKVEDIPMPGEELQVQLAADLWEKGLLMTRTPLSSYPFDETVVSEDEENRHSSDVSSTDEEASAEEEEDEEDRAFIDDEEDVSEESDFTDSEEENEAPRLTKRKKSSFIL